MAPYPCHHVYALDIKIDFQWQSVDNKEKL
jgi:hypothetical protein